jgi:hypothetical protein
LSDDRRSPEELEIEQAAKASPPPPRRTEPGPCRRYIDNPVTAEEGEEFLKELESK